MAPEPALGSDTSNGRLALSLSHWFSLRLLLSVLAAPSAPTGRSGIPLPVNPPGVSRPDRLVLDLGCLPDRRTASGRCRRLERVLIAASRRLSSDAPNYAIYRRRQPTDRVPTQRSDQGLPGLKAVLLGPRVVLDPRVTPGQNMVRHAEPMARGPEFGCQLEEDRSCFNSRPFDDVPESPLLLKGPAGIRLVERDDVGMTANSDALSWDLSAHRRGSRRGTRPVLGGYRASVGLW